MRGPRDCTTTGLALALVAVCALVLLPESRRPAEAAVPALTAAWPEARISTSGGNLADGAIYTPLLYLDPATSVGLARSPDADGLKLVLRPESGPPHTIRELPAAGSPEIVGLTGTAGELVWAETSATDPGVGSLWRSGPRGEQPRQLTDRLGALLDSDSQHDLVVHNGQVSWATISPHSTEIRSVPLTGGPVGTITLPGRYALHSWPWVVNAAIEQPGPTDLIDLDTRHTVRVPAEGAELLACTPAWCRIQVLRQGGTARLEMKRPDGRDRHRIGQYRPAITDVTLLDRFVPLRADTGAGDELALHDLHSRRLAVLAADPGTVQARGHLLWWSTGDNAELTWHALDLRSVK
ncbi:hypothetical protein [Crossiella cryophila]|uniref:Uncharacterized protein n=1 Tax=Crossiella cryophila TaxID=43355 RepID=A0A7W7CF13_9PSEU|nr:hypothetical protein [Crossiella cryophila]MBB4679961.1 hypothetical protein [Crossiella cryophila]